MEIREIKATADMDGFGIPHPISGVLFGGEELAHKFIVAEQSGEAFAGTVSAKFLRYADDQTVPLTGSIEDGKATVTLIKNCYYLPGRFKLTIYVTANGSTTAVYCCMGTVDRTDGRTTVDPSGEINLDVTDLINRINAAVGSWATADAAKLYDVTAPDYTELTFPVLAGEYCWYNGELYQALVDIPTAESFTLSHWIYGNIGKGLGELYNAVLRKRAGLDIVAATTDKDLNHYLSKPGWFGIAYTAVAGIQHGPAGLQDGFPATVVNVTDAMYGGTTIQYMITEYASWYRIMATDGSSTFLPWTRCDPMQARDAMRYNPTDLIAGLWLKKTRTSAGVTYTWTGGNYHVSGGPASGSSGHSLIAGKTEHQTPLPEGVTAGGTYYLKYHTTDARVLLSIWYYDANGDHLEGQDIYRTGNGTVTIPDGAVQWWVWLYVGNGTSFDEDAIVDELALLDQQTMAMVEAGLSDRISALDAAALKNTGVLANGTDLDTIKEASGFYLLNSTYSYTHMPFAPTYSGVLVTYAPHPNITLQLAYDNMPGGYLWHRMWSRNGSGWYEWRKYDTPKPTALNHVLESTGDQTDRASEITAMLTTYGACELGPGNFYVSNIVMPGYSTLRGSGIGRTVIRMLTDATGHCVKLNTRCSLQDLTLVGQAADSTQNNSRNAVAWVGTNTTAGGTSETPSRSLVDNIQITGFDGAGIYMEHTGTPTVNNMSVSNAHIYGCWAGIHVKKLSEYCKFVNIDVTRCVYGCIDNGGNNLFANCAFDSCGTGLRMGSLDSQDSPNNSHGGFSNCAFNHSGGNTGTAIHIIGMPNGEMFTGCQVFYGKIIIDSSAGIVFSACNLGRNTGLEITGSKAIVFDKCMIDRAGTGYTTLTQSGNAGLVFDGCMARYDGSAYAPV